MKNKNRQRHMSSLLAAMTLALAGASASAAPPTPGGGKVVVANRGSGTVSVIGVHSDEVIATIELPAGDAAPEPMYVYYSPVMHRVFVGDRGNDRVIAYDANTFEVEGIVSAGAGVFHMWGGTSAGQLWVNNDVDRTTTVIDLQTLEPIATVSTPADLVADGGKPHDVILSPNNAFAYVTVVGVEGENDYVVQYLTLMPEVEIGRAAVGKDAHLSVTQRNPWLFVPCQNSDAVYVLDRFSLAVVEVIDVPGAHGAGMPNPGRFFYTTNLPGGGTNGLYVIDTKTLTVVGEPVDTPYAAPHNIALTPSGGKLYVTHSGANDKVTVYEASNSQPVPVYAGEITVGNNPFGLAYVH